MKKIYFIITFLSLTASSAFAGGLLTNTNQSVHFLRNPARDASTEIDAVYTNPAGLTFLTDGFHLSLNNQSAFQTRTITSTFAPFAVNNDGNPTKIYTGKAQALIIPSFQLAYKKDAYVISAAFAVIGGGGKAVFNDGLPSFEAPVSMIPLSLTSMGVPTTAYLMDCYMEGSQYIFGLQLNGSYKINEAFSGALGLRLNMVKNGYKGHLTDIQINPHHPLLNPTGDMMSANTFFTNAGMTTQAAGTADKQLESTQTGMGVTPIVSINYHLDGLNLSAKYEFKSAIELQNHTVIDNTGLYTDGVKTPSDIPAYLAIGGEYELSEKWKVSGGYHHFFDSDAKMANDKQQYINGGVNEYLFGSEYTINDLFLVSAGTQISRTGVTDPYQSDMSFSLNTISVGLGGAVNITPKLRLNVAYFFTNFSDWTKTTAASTVSNGNGGYKGYNGTPLTGTDVYGRTSMVFGIGLDYKF